MDNVLFELHAQRRGLKKKKHPVRSRNESVDTPSGYDGDLSGNAASPGRTGGRGRGKEIPRGGHPNTRYYHQFNHI